MFGSGLRPATGAILGRRAEQQDAMLTERIVRPDGSAGLLLIVADGMGGHAGGQVASRIAVETFSAAWQMGAMLLPAERLRAALEIANRAIGAKSLERPELSGMGCTLVAALVFGDQVRWISVGDSLLLAIRNRELIRLNADHSLAPELDRAVKAGRITQVEADLDPNRHVLLSALSGGRIEMIDEGQQRLGAGAFVLLATDGLLSLPASRIAELGSGSLPATRKIAALLEAVAADMPDDQDNTSLVAVHCGRPSRPGGAGHYWRLALGLILLLAALAAAAFVTSLLAEEDAVRKAADERQVDQPATQVRRTIEGVAVKGPAIESPRPGPRPARPRPRPDKGGNSSAERRGPAPAEKAAAAGESRSGTPSARTPSPPAPAPGASEDAPRAAVPPAAPHAGRRPDTDQVDR